MSQNTATAAEILAMIRSKQDPIWTWRRQFLNEEQWTNWLTTPEATAEILADPRKGQSWFESDNENAERIAELVQRLRSRHG